MESKKKTATCCFTGHRPEKLKQSEGAVKAALRREIELAVAEGFTDFITGMARGVDLWAAEEVLELKAESPALRLIAALPFPRFEAGWSPEWQARYRRVLAGADQRFIISPAFSYAAFQKRNPLDGGPLRPGHRRLWRRPRRHLEHPRIRPGARASPYRILPG